MSTLTVPFLIVKIVELAAVSASPNQFDVSSRILLDRYSQSPSVILSLLPSSVISSWLTTHILDKLVSWDSVYFLKLALDGIAFEHEWVFSPLLWRTIRLITPANGNIYDSIIVSLLLSNVCHLLSCYILRRLTYKVFEKHVNTITCNRIANICSLLCVIQPSGIFSTVGYSESISQLLCYSGLYMRRLALDGKKRRYYFLSGVMFAVAFGFRSNCLLYGILYLYDLAGSLKIHNYRHALSSIAAGSFLLMTLIYSIYIPYEEYCPERGEWCHSVTKSLASYAQGHYWNVGLFKYFVPGNIPLFIMALPQLVTLLLSLVNLYEYSDLKGEWIVSFVYLLTQFFIMHVQIVNRVSTFIPIHFWFLGMSLVGMNSNRMARYSHWTVIYWLIWVIVQTGLYASFLPPA